MTKYYRQQAGHATRKRTTFFFCFPLRLLHQLSRPPM